MCVDTAYAVKLQCGKEYGFVGWHSTAESNTVGQTNWRQALWITHK